MARPQKYNDEELLELLREVRSSVTGDLSPYLLEKHTGVSKAVWIKRMSEEIEGLNKAFNEPYNEPYNEDTGSSSAIGLKNVSTIYQEHKDNEKMLISKLNSYDIFVNNLIRTIQELKAKETELDVALNLVQEKELQVTQLSEELSNEKERTKHYENKYLEAVTQSGYSKNYRTINSSEPLSMENEDNLKKVDFINKNKNLFE